ncbi:hypothetical protein NKH77_39650 [Streptomyces sp. M19]
MDLPEPVDPAWSLPDASPGRVTATMAAVAVTARAVPATTLPR